MKIKIIGTVLCVLALAVGIYAFAAEYGTQEDPLVSLSYINSVFKPQLIAEVDEKVSSATSAIQAYENRVDKKVTEVIDRSSATVSDEDLTNVANSIAPSGKKPTAPFTTVALKSGEKITLEAGAEILARGNLSVTSGSLIDITAGSTASELLANHLCTCSESVSLRANSAVTVLIRGSYYKY